MSPKGNQRIMLTKRLVKESLVALLHEKRIHKISIRELCDDAGINRTTFYKYYSSQYDVLFELEEELLTHIQDSLTKYPEETHNQLTAICTYLDQNVELIRLLTDNNVDPDFPSKLFNLPQLRSMLHEKLDQSFDKQSVDYAFIFISNGGYHLIREWINRDQRKTPSEIATLILELTEKVSR